MQTRLTASAWVGHRGWPERYPENTLLGVGAALREGAQAVEVDIQFSADAEPVLMHDATLTRVAGVPGRVDALSFAQLSKISVHEPGRLGPDYAPECIPHLRDLLKLMARFPDRVLFVEIKSDVFERYDRAFVLRRLVEYLTSAPCSFYLISYDLPLIQLAKAECGWSIGWVLKRFDDVSRAIELNPTMDVMICDLRKVPPSLEELPQGGWDWFIYDVVEPQDIDRCRALNVKWLETWDIGRVCAYTTQCGMADDAESCL